MEFYIQDRNFEDACTLHEAIIRACEGATSGVGVYAFVSASGAELLLEDEAFDSFLSSANFRLIVGIDEVTNERALLRLGTIETLHSDSLTVEVFFPDNRNSLFHPKFIWFRKPNGGTMVIGSGNLTVAGMRHNREAFSVIEVDRIEAEEIEGYLNNWIVALEDHLKQCDDETVIERARLNNRIRTTTQPTTQESHYEDFEQAENEFVDLLEDEPGSWTFEDFNSVLVAEIPDNNYRWKQANFTKTYFENFFGALPGQNDHHRILLRNVQSNGLLGTTEVRKTVSVRSQNYRIELGAATGSYPQEGRPIGVFIRISVRDFIYIIVMPSDNFYQSISHFLSANYTGPTRQVRRFDTNVAILRENCPELPLWNVRS